MRGLIEGTVWLNSVHGAQPEERSFILDRTILGGP